MSRKNRLKLIAVSPENYRKLRELGKKRESFEFVISKLLKEIGTED